MPVNNSRIPGLYNKSIEERREVIAQQSGIPKSQFEVYDSINGLSQEKANNMIENVIGTLALPVGIATNFVIDGRDYVIPFCVEESSIIAAASNIARRCRSSGGFHTNIDPPIMIGQLQILDLKDIDSAIQQLEIVKQDIIERCNNTESKMIALGGGCKDVSCRKISVDGLHMLIVHLHIDCRDAMGANAVNSMAERIAPFIESITGGRVHLKILSNLATDRLARATATFTPLEMSLDGTEASGRDVIEKVMEAYLFAKGDPHRAATHNKGIMNAISSVAIACGQDWRAIEAGCHAYAAINGSYGSMTRWHVDTDGNLIGHIEVPIAVGIVGGASKVHPVAMANLEILGITSAAQLAGIMVCAGLAQNLGAMRALATDGIQKGHMKLHVKNMAMTSGANESEIDELVQRIYAQKEQITQSLVNDLLEQMRKD
jgi:hydroxymethylglutaryl-CoA reductase